MASMKEIRSRMKSVEQTLKITNAMYLISSASLRKAKQQLESAEPYFLKIYETIADILHYSPGLQHRFFADPSSGPAKERRVGYIVVTGDKGLAGAYNHNVLKLAQERLSQWKNSRLFIVGVVGRAYFQERGIPIEEEFSFVAQKPTMHRATEIGDQMVRLFLEGELDEVHIIYTQMISSLRQEVREQKLLPLTREDFPWKQSSRPSYYQEMTYVPSEEAVLDNIVPSGYLRGMIFGALVESFCSEQSARMTAMQSASDNAKEMLKRLSFTYNRVRQGAITQEITEIAGAAQHMLGG